MGPSIDASYERGRVAYNEVLALLKAKYGAVDDTRGFNFGNLNQVNLNRRLANLKLAIQEVLWDSDCHTF